MVHVRDRRLRDAVEDLRPTAEAFGRAVVILWSGVMFGYLILTLVHTMAFWHSPGIP